MKTRALSLLKIALPALALLALSTQAQAEEAFQNLECSYTGSWSGKAAPVPFTWTGYWFAADGGWVYYANGSDKFGKYRIHGSCGYGDCSFDLKYISGQLTGKQYGFNMLYKGEIGNTGPRTMAFNGTWGTGESYKGGGSWKATPKCKVSPVENINKALGWPEE